MPRKPRKLAPFALVREPCPVTLATVAGLRASKLTDCAKPTVTASKPRMNSTIRHNRYCANHASKPTFALKNPHAARITPRGGGGAPGRALFSYNSYHPPRNFLPIRRHTSPDANRSPLHGSFTLLLDPLSVGRGACNRHSASRILHRMVHRIRCMADTRLRI